MTLSDFNITYAAASSLLMLIGAFTLIVSLLFAVFYFLRAIGIYGMSRSLNLKNSWYGFIPFFNFYALGRIADENSVKKGSKAVFAPLLFAVKVFSAVLSIVCIISFGMGCLKLLFDMDEALSAGTTVAFSFREYFNALIIPLVVTGAVKIAEKIVYWIALWKVYSLFNKKNAPLFIILSIIFGFLSPLFIYSIRKNMPLSYDEFDNGMFTDVS